MLLILFVTKTQISISHYEENHKIDFGEKQREDCFDNLLFKNGSGGQDLLASNNLDIVQLEGTPFPPLPLPLQI